MYKGRTNILHVVQCVLCCSLSATRVEPRAFRFHVSFWTSKTGTGWIAVLLFTYNLALVPPCMIISLVFSKVKSASNASSVPTPYQILCSNFRPFWPRSSRFYPARCKSHSVEKRGDQIRFKSWGLYTNMMWRSRYSPSPSSSASRWVCWAAITTRRSSSRCSDRSVLKTPLFWANSMQNRSVYRHRLGTNRRKRWKKEGLCPQETDRWYRAVRKTRFM